jgi:5-methylcytosine-specific restriction endonuclease McrA
MRDATPCSVEGCDKPIKTKKDMLCTGHHSRLYRTGSVQAKLPLLSPKTGTGVCSLAGCDKVTTSGRSELCDGHYRRLRKIGSAMADVPFKQQSWAGVKCKADACDEQARSLGWCQAHYLQQYLTRDSEPCTTQGCKKPAKVLRTGLCSKHDAQRRLAAIKADPAKLEEFRAYQREFKAAQYAKDPERHNQYKKAYKKAWDAANPEKAKARRARSNNRRRIAEANAPKIPFTPAELADRMRYWGNRCWMCHGDFDAIDHVKPVSKRGYEALANLRPICIRCNTFKGAKWPFPTSSINPPQRPRRLELAVA